MDEQYEQIEPLSPAAFFAIFFGSILALIALLGFFIFIGYNLKFRKCTPLNSGLYLGYNAVVDLRGWGLKPFVVPKLPDGTPLVDQEIRNIVITQTSFHGVAYRTAWTPSYSFAWRKDMGMIRVRHDEQDENKLAAYRTIVREAGPGLNGLGSGNYDAGFAMLELRWHHGYEKIWCSTRLIGW